MIASVEATGSTIGDVVMLAPLLESSIEAAHAIPYIPFKANRRRASRSDAVTAGTVTVIGVFILKRAPVIGGN